MKASPRWRTEYGSALRELREGKVLTASYAVYLGDTQQQDGPVRVLPLPAFLRELPRGRILPGAGRSG